ncbi:hypothetical protein D915_002134 [Fasciola hepatica]|uniref:Uncharacterized protein n=1 Tax=Fasciola hepatica TaxID=6192 RepID=A0A2H1CPM5_FASHE|nr:hypothetical protein D915_002134 [Fasciola hepatica]
MSSDQEPNGSEPPKVPKPAINRPVGGVSIFGGNPCLLGDLKARLRKSNSSEDDSTSVQSSKNPSETCSPINTNTVINEIPSSLSLNDAGTRPQSPSSLTSQTTNDQLVNLTLRRARKPNTRPPTIRFSKFPTSPDADVDDSSDKKEDDSDELNKFFNPIESEAEIASSSRLSPALLFESFSEELAPQAISGNSNVPNEDVRSPPTEELSNLTLDDSHNQRVEESVNPPTEQLIDPPIADPKHKPIEEPIIPPIDSQSKPSVAERTSISASPKTKSPPRPTVPPKPKKQLEDERGK